VHSADATIVLIVIALATSLATATDDASDDRDARKVTDEHTGQVIGLEDYNAQLLEELKNTKATPETEDEDGGLDDGLVDDGLDGRIIGTSVATSASSAISFPEVTSPQPPREDAEAAGSHVAEQHSSEDMEDVLEAKVDPKDPYLEAVFPHFAAEYQVGFDFIFGKFFLSFLYGKFVVKNFHRRNTYLWTKLILINFGI
jgi:hypothetical protein